EPLLSSTLLLPDEEEPMTQGWEIKERLDHAVDAVLDGGDCGTEPTTVVDLSQREPEILRRGAADPSRFECQAAAATSGGDVDVDAAGVTRYLPDPEADHAVEADRHGDVTFEVTDDHVAAHHRVVQLAAAGRDQRVAVVAVGCGWEE